MYDDEPTGILGSRRSGAVWQVEASRGRGEKASEPEREMSARRFFLSEDAIE